MIAKQLSNVVPKDKVENTESEEETAKQRRDLLNKQIQRDIDAHSKLSFMEYTHSCNMNDIYSVPPEYQYRAKQIIENNIMMMDDDD